MAAGHVTRFRRAQPDRIVRSRQPAHPAIVSVEEFTQAQLMRRTRAAGGMRGRAKLTRTRSTGTRPYLFRGLIRCGICRRRMQGTTVRQHDTYYRCLARTLAPGSAALADHPKTVNVRQDQLLEPLNGWIGRLFDRDNLDRTVAALVASQASAERHPTGDSAKRRLTQAGARLRRFQDAIASGVDPAAMVEAINEAQSERAAARAERDGRPAPNALTDAEVYAMVDSLGDVGAALARTPATHAPSP